MSKKKTKKKINKKEPNKESGIVEVMVGCLIFGTSDFNGGNIFEKIVVLMGLVIFMVGIFNLLPNYRKENKKGMIVFLSIMGILAIAVFCGLLFKLFGLF